jgi:hypothetical protein
MNYEEIIEVIRQAGGGPKPGHGRVRRPGDPSDPGRAPHPRRGPVHSPGAAGRDGDPGQRKNNPLLAPTAVGSTTITAATWPPGGFAKSPDPGPVPCRGDGPRWLNNWLNRSWCHLLSDHFDGGAYRMAGSRIIQRHQLRSRRSRRDYRPARGGLVFELRANVGAQCHLGDLPYLGARQGVYDFETFGPLVLGQALSFQVSADVGECRRGLRFRGTT